MKNLRAIILISASAMLAACGSDTSGTITTPEGEVAEYQIDEATGETSMSITTPEGTASMRSGSGVPVNLPEGFTLYPGSTILTSTLVNQPDGQGTMVMFEAAATPDEIMAHFKQQAKQAGFAIELEAMMNDTMMLSGKRAADGTSFMVNTGGAMEGDTAGMTSGQLVIGSEKSPAR